MRYSGIYAGTVFKVEQARAAAQELAGTLGSGDVFPCANGDGDQSCPVVKRDSVPETWCQACRAYQYATLAAAELAEIEARCRRCVARRAAKSATA